MCLYDDMRVQVSPALTISVIKQSNHKKSRQNLITKNVLKILGQLRLWTIIVLLLNPASAIPLKRIPKVQSKGSHISHSNKEGIGIDTASTVTTDRAAVSIDREIIHSTESPTHSVPSSIARLLAIVPSSSRGSLRKSLLIKMDSTDLAGRSRRSSGGEAAIQGGESSLAQEVSQGSWMEPCSNHNLMEAGSVSQQELSLHILTAIVEANSQVENFIDPFSDQAFGGPWKDASDHSGYMLDFLNTSSNVDLRSNSVTFEEALQEAYELLQRLAVGIEQVTLDQALYQSSYLAKFRNLERRIVTILCQLRHAMMGQNVSPRDSVTKDIMPESARSVESEQSRNIRDAVILREYINSLHLLHAVFNNFSQK